VTLKIERSERQVMLKKRYFGAIKLKALNKNRLRSSMAGEP
jgi:hypothetical protein